MRFLPEILALQRDLVKWFQNASEAQYPSIGDFIESHSSGGTLWSPEIRMACGWRLREHSSSAGGQEGAL